ncbi:MAG TPA: TolC family protein [Desulfomonilia bacterium]|jgi:outer membrane protein TolC
MKTLKISLSLMLIFIIIQPQPVSADNDGKPLSLADSINIALENSLLIKSADEGVSYARAKKKEAGTGFLPMFSASYNYTRLSDDPYVDFPGNPPFMPATTITTGTKDNYTLAFEVKQPIFTGGAIYYNYLANKTGEDVASQEKRQNVLIVIEEVKTAYYSILKAVKVKDAAVKSVEMLKGHRDMAKAYYDVHLVPLNDLLRAEVEVANAQRNLLAAENAIEIANANFNTILRRGINTPVDIIDSFEVVPFDRGIDECINMAINMRPEMKAAVARQKQSESLLKVEKAGFVPVIGATGRLERYGDHPELQGSPYRQQDDWYISAAATWNFWEWGKTKNRVDAGRARVNQADNAILQTGDRIALEVKRAWLDLKEAEKQVSVTKSMIKSAEENFRVSSERYKEQLGTAVDVLDAQSLLTKARADYARAVGDYNILMARIERVIGITGNESGGIK